MENTSGEALRQSLTSQRIILDSDIILDFLCKAERDHRTSSDLLRGWLKVGGHILVSPIVLEEVAHHAWISERDFKETESLLGKLRPDELARYIKSASVRTFHSFKAPALQWPIYIKQFKGNSSGDYTKILAHLRQQLKVEILPSSYNEELKNKYVRFISEKSNSEESDSEHVEDVNYKVERDGKLLASIAAARHIEVAAGSEEPMVLLTSSIMMRLATVRFRDDFGEGRVVLHKRAFAYLLASIPQASLGADTLRRALFEFGAHAHLKSSGRKALRLIRASQAYDLPWAERLTLQRQLSLVIREEAAKRGRSRSEVSQELKNGSNPETSAMLIVKSIQNLGIPSAIAVELEEAKRRVKALELEIAQSKTPRRTSVHRS